MGAIESNRWYANLLGWTPADFGKHDFDAGLVAAIEDAQRGFALKIDGICGIFTCDALLRERARALLVAGATPSERLANAGMVAVCEAKRAWMRNIVDLPLPGSDEYEPCRAQIEHMIRSDDGIAWDWESPYAQHFEWCGAFAGYAWRAAGMKLGLRKTFFSSTYRLDRWARYQAFDNHQNPRPGQGPLRRVIDLGERSGPLDAHFADGDPPRPGDILLVGGVNTAYGKHVTLIESYDSMTGVFTTLEGNATGRGPSGGTRHGVIRGARPIDLPSGQAPSTYHARRLIRPGLADLAA
jgi:hypothetical protein